MKRITMKKIIVKLKALLLNRPTRVKTNVNISYENIAEGEMDNGVIIMERLPLGGNIIIYCAGIGDQINFELDLLDKLSSEHVELYAFDPTPKTIEWLKRQKLPKNFHFFPYALSGKDCKLEFALPKSEGWISGTVENVKNDERNLDFDNTIQVQGRSIESIMKELGHDRIDFLKMDIEGSEFDALSAAFDAKLNITQLLVDHHEYMFKEGKGILKAFLTKLDNENYKIYYSAKTGCECIGCIKQ